MCARLALGSLLASLLIGALPAIGWALHASSATGEVNSANSRLLRSEDSSFELHPGQEHKTEVMHIELDSSGMGRTDALPAALTDRLKEPLLQNGGFDETDKPETGYAWQTELPHWQVFGSQGAASAVALVASGASAFGDVQSVDGTNLLGLRTRGNGISQEVSGHTKESWYTLLFHASCHNAQTQATEAKLKVSVTGSAKFDEDVSCGPMRWYKVSYQSFGDFGNEMIRFEIPAGAESDQTVVLLDKIVLMPEVPWNFLEKGTVSFGGGSAGSSLSFSGGQVLIQKVECATPASKLSCTRGKFLTCGGYDEDGATEIVETSAASDCSVFTAQKQSSKSVKWKFKCNCLNQASEGADDEDSGQAVDKNWYLHSGYGPNTCQAKNGDPGFDKNFDVRENLVGSLQLTTTGISCGSLFAIMRNS